MRSLPQASARTALATPCSARGLVDDRAVLRWGDWFPPLPSRLEPGGLGDLDFADGLLRGGAARRAEFQIGNVGHVAAVLVAVEHVDVVIFHPSSESLTAVPERASGRAGCAECERTVYRG